MNMHGKARTNSVATPDKAELMHSCEPCARPFAGERSLFQHAAAVHGYDETADRAASASQPVPYAVGTAPWPQGERRMVIADQAGVRVLRDVDVKVGDTAASTHHSKHGSASTVSGLTCGACERAFLTVRALTDHAEAVHDSALDATYSEREQLVSNHIRKVVNSANSYNRLYCYTVDMTDTFVVYQVEGMEASFQADYSISDDGVVTLGEPVAVRRRTVYEPVGSA